MPSIPYDPTRSALYTPAVSLAPLWVAGGTYTDEQLAVEAARLAYLKAEQSEVDRTTLTNVLAMVSFASPVVFNDSATGGQAFGAFRATDGLALLAFRGTQPDESTDIQADLTATLTPWRERSGRVHKGFASRWRALRGPIEEWLGRQCAQRSRLLLCGHSLGAALATLSATVWTPAVLITIGSPRVGNEEFAEAIDVTKTKRLVNCCDLVTQVPPELSSLYVHVAHKTYIDRKGNTHDDPDGGLVAEDRTRARARYLVEESWKVGNVVVRDLADHAPINYARAVLP